MSRPLALGRYVIVGDYQGYVHLLSREDGSFAGRIATDGSQIAAAPVVLESEPGEYSYPAVIQTTRGEIHTLYTWKRRKIRHVAFDARHPFRFSTSMA